MKKKGLLLSFAVCVFAVMTLCGCGAKEKLKIYLPGEYMSDELIPDFEKMYNVKVDVELFDSNEMMYTKVMAGDSYDVLIPSDYMIERLIKEDYLQKIDVTKLENFGDVTDALKVAPYNGFDPDNSYSVPYFWGSVGIVYNEKNVPSSEVEAKGFDIMKDTKYAGKIYMYDSERDSFMIATKLPAWEMHDKSDVDRIFNEQLTRAGVDYFDFYLLHSIEEGNNYDTYVKYDCFNWGVQKNALSFLQPFSVHPN